MTAAYVDCAFVADKLAKGAICTGADNIIII